MLTFLQKFLKKSKAGGEGPYENSASRGERLRSILLQEMNGVQVDGKPVTHRRLESLMAATQTGKRETVKLLKEIGARPSKRYGVKLWTRKEPRSPQDSP